MARRKKRHANRKHRHHNKRRHGLFNARRHHRKANRRRHHNRRRGWKLFNPGPDVVKAGESLAAALFAGAAGYVAAKAIGIAAEVYLPDSIPQKSLVGTAASSIAAAVLASKLLKDKPKVAAGVITGATIPLAEELLAMTPVGPMIGLIPADAAAAAAQPAALPAPGGMSAPLAARLGAHLQDAEDECEDDAVEWAGSNY